MSKPRPRGFTLIELLTVIAIIAILVGITAAVLPGVLERAKVTKTETSFKQLQTALAAYQTDHGSLPPGYGYVIVNPDTNVATYNTVPYMSAIGLFREYNLYDEYWATNYDFTGNGQIDALEFQPLGTKSGNRYIFDPALYDGSNFAPAVTAMLSNTEQPPYAYFPVNRAQADKVRQYCEADLNDQDRIFARSTTGLSDLFAAMSFPPPYYDDYVLISPGPAGKTFGVIISNGDMMNDPNTDDGHNDTYYINALRTYYLATRDLPLGPNQDGDGKPDFDFRARTRGGQGTYALPDGSFGAGPLIYHGGR